MTRTQGNLAALSQYVFRAPQWYSSLAFALVIAAVAGVGAFDSRFVLEDAWQGIFFIGIPTAVASVGIAWVDQRLGGQLSYNRASLLALTGELLIVAVLTVAGVIAALTAFGQKFVFDALTVGLASVFALQLLIVMAVSGKSLLGAAIPAGVQTVTAAVLLFVYGGTMRFVEIGGPIVRSFLYRSDQAPRRLAEIAPVDFALLALLCGFYAFAVWVFLVVIDRPWRRSLDVSVLDFVRGFVGHIAEDSRELEAFFESIGEEAIVPVTVSSFRRRDGTEKARFVLPMVHPGPMGEIGGGNLPARIARSAEGLAFPPHATAGHDFNLVTEREVDTIVASANRAAASIVYTDRASTGGRTQVGEATVLGQRFGEDLLLVSTYAPAFADDIEYAVGLAATSEARAAGARTATLIDAHNSNNGLSPGGLGHVVPGSQRSFDLMEAVSQVTTDRLTAPGHPLELGVAWDRTPWSTTEGIGPLGVRIAVFDTGGERTAYVLIDGNNMEPGLRDRIVSRLEGTVAADGSPEATSASMEAGPGGWRPGGATGPVDVAEVMTTDTHVVNTVKSVNQVGAALPADELMTLIERLVGEATTDLEPVEAGMEREDARVTVFGNDRTETLASHANAMIGMGGAFALAVIAAVLAISALIFFLTGAG
jgi:putative membrane protein